MSATSSSDIDSLRPTSPRSCDSVSGSGVESRSAAHWARLKSTKRDTVATVTAPSPGRKHTLSPAADNRAGVCGAWR